MVGCSPWNWRTATGLPLYRVPGDLDVVPIGHVGQPIQQGLGGAGRDPACMPCNSRTMTLGTLAANHTRISTEMTVLQRPMW